MAITDWPLEERPRERLLRHGSAALTDAELVAIFLRTGRRGHSAVGLARDALARFGDLRALSSTPIVVTTRYRAALVWLVSCSFRPPWSWCVVTS